MEFKEFEKRFREVSEKSLSSVRVVTERSKEEVDGVEKDGYSFYQYYDRSEGDKAAETVGLKSFISDDVFSKISNEADKVARLGCNAIKRYLEENPPKFEEIKGE